MWMCNNLKQSSLYESDHSEHGHRTKTCRRTFGRWSTWHTQFLYIICSFQSSTCFEQTRAHHQEVTCVNTASAIVTLCKWPSGRQVEQFLIDLCVKLVTYQKFYMFWSYDHAQNDPTRRVITASGYYTFTLIPVNALITITFFPIS
jgi:hypothetical protein